MPFQRKHIRLAKLNYVGCRIYFLTLCCEGRRPWFRTSENAQWAIGCLREKAALHNFAVLAYCVMPDHIHMVVEGLDTASHVLRFVQVFKQMTAFHFQKKFGRQLWQKNSTTTSSARRMSSTASSGMCG